MLKHGTWNMELLRVEEGGTMYITCYKKGNRIVLKRHEWKLEHTPMLSKRLKLRSTSELGHAACSASSVYSVCHMEADRHQQLLWHEDSSAEVLTSRSISSQVRLELGIPSYTSN